MSASFTHFGAQRDQLYEVFTPHERGQLHLPVTESDLLDWGLCIPTNGVSLPWRTKGEFTMSVFFDFPAVQAWCNAQVTWSEFVEGSH